MYNDNYTYWFHTRDGLLFCYPINNVSYLYYNVIVDAKISHWQIRILANAYI